MSPFDGASAISITEVVLFHTNKFSNQAAYVLNPIKKAIDMYKRKGNELPEVKGEIL